MLGVVGVIIKCLFNYIDLPYRSYAILTRMDDEKTVQVIAAVDIKP